MPRLCIHIGARPATARAGGLRRGKTSLCRLQTSPAHQPEMKARGRANRPASPETGIKPRRIPAFVVSNTKLRFIGSTVFLLTRPPGAYGRGGLTPSMSAPVMGKSQAARPVPFCHALPDGRAQPKRWFKSISGARRRFWRRIPERGAISRKNPAAMTVLGDARQDPVRLTVPLLRHSQFRPAGTRPRVVIPTHLFASSSART